MIGKDGYKVMVVVVVHNKFQARVQEVCPMGLSDIECSNGKDGYQ